jgi:cell division transport system ATP-binding protein
MTTVADAGQEHLVRFQRVASDVREGVSRLGALSFTLDAQARVCLVGPAGSGKTLALDLISRLAPPPRGRIEIFGADVGRLNRGQRAGLRRRLGPVFQDLRLVDDLGALDNVALAARAAGRHREDYLSEAMELLDWVGLGKRRDQMAGALNSDGRWRLALARALVNGPDLIVIDEPGRDLPQDLRRALLKRIADAHQAGIALIIALDEAAAAFAGDGPIIRVARAPDRETAPSEPS